MTSLGPDFMSRPRKGFTSTKYVSSTETNNDPGRLTKKGRLNTALIGIHHEHCLYHSGLVFDANTEISSNPGIILGKYYAHVPLSCIMPA